MMRTRIFSALVGMALLLTVLLSEALVIQVAFVVVCVLMLFELFQVIGFYKKIPLVFLSVISFLLPAALLMGEFTHRQSAMWLVYIYGCIIFATYLLFFKQIALKEICEMFCLTFVVSFFMSYIVHIRTSEAGNILVWAVFVGAWGSDTSAYFSGRFVGKHPFAPGISPNKTVEGCVGGVVGACIGFLVYGLIIRHIVPHYNINFIRLLILGIFSSVIAQAGDLVASLIKRETGVKDFGSIMPGHGGVLDRFDSIVFLAPFTYYYIQTLPFLEAM